MLAPTKLTQTVEGWAAMEAKGKIIPFVFKRRENGEDDVSIRVLYCGMCDTDLLCVSSDSTFYPLVPGHEITGEIMKVGKNVSNFKVGNRIGVGCLATSCQNCDFCKNSQENCCSKINFNIHGEFLDGSNTYGGYCKMLVVNQRYVVHIPDNLPLESAAPLLCAGITAFSPMKDNNMLQAGKKLGVVGLGGIGHLVVKFGKAFGQHVTVISTSPSKEKDAKLNLGADDFINITDNKQMHDKRRTQDYIIDTVSAKHSLLPILDLLKENGKLVLVGAPNEPFEIPSFPFISGKWTVSGGLAGGVKDIQELMDICGKHNITSDIELIKPNYINEALDRIRKNDVRYRFVIDITGE